MKRLVILGAGASRGTSSSTPHPIPTAGEFGRALADLRPRWRSHFPGLARVVSDHLRRTHDQFTLEELWTCVDWYAKLGRALPSPRWAPGDDVRFGPELKKALLDVYGSRCDLIARGLPRNDTYTLGAIFANGLSRGDVLASFNYDTLAERLALETFKLELRGQTGSARAGGIAFTKPHGSVSWSMNPPTRAVRWAAPGGAPILDALSSEDVDHGVEPLVLGAVPIKSELIREVQSWPSEHGTSWKQVFELILAQWKVLADAVAQADRITVVGYSFPREDAHGRFFIREAVRTRSAPPQLEFFEVEARAKEQAKELFDTFDGRVSEIAYLGPVRPPSAAG